METGKNNIDIAAYLEPSVSLHSQNMGPEGKSEYDMEE